MPDELPTLAAWDAIAPAEREEIALALGKRLPRQFRFVGLETHQLGDQRHSVAFYAWSKDEQGAGEEPMTAETARGLQHRARLDGRFAFLPGGEVTLGYDPEHPFVPNEDQHQSWEESRQEFGLPALEDYLQRCLTPLRRVAIAPLLLEVVAIGLDDPPIIEDGRRVHHMKPVKRSEVQKFIEHDGFRFPTSDEWEYACAAGSRTLFRWGNECPLLLIPQRSEEPPVWDVHLRPNAFGLMIGHWPYDWEFCAEEGVMRGGDGGVALHHDAGRFAAWLTLATAYYHTWKGQYFSTYLRRAYSLA